MAAEIFLRLLENYNLLLYSAGEGWCDMDMAGLESLLDAFQAEHAAEIEACTGLSVGIPWRLPADHPRTYEVDMMCDTEAQADAAEAKIGAALRQALGPEVAVVFGTWDQAG